MGYLLVNAEVLKSKGVKNFETMPDGRAIVDFSMLRVLGSVQNAEIVSSAGEMLMMIKDQEESGLYNQPEVPSEGNTPLDGEKPSEGAELPNFPSVEEIPSDTPAENPSEDDPNTSEDAPVQKEEQTPKEEVAPSENVEGAAVQEEKKTDSKQKKGGES